MPYSNVVARPVKWFGVNRGDLPAVLEGRMPPPDSLQDEPSTEISVGLFVADEDRPILTLIVVADQQIPEFLAWISTFAQEVFPLSQSVRILAQSEFAGIENVLRQGGPYRRDFVWPSVILGEMLAQGEPAPNLQTLPLSRASASFSFCQARASLIYSFNSRVQKITSSRLSQLQREKSFTQRTVNVEDMSAIWSFVDETSSCTPFQRNWVRSIVEIADLGLDSNRSAAFTLERMGINLQRLASGTIEGRVLEFEKAIALTVNAVSSDVDLRSNIPLIIASLCFLVGGGTSHISLLDEFAGDFPMVYAWFGLLAGLSGPGSWDSQWARISTSVERQLRSGFSIYDPPSADVCWVEYDWIASQRRSLPWLKELPKLYPRLVSVEVVPGASCQFRLSDSEEHDRQIHEARPANRSIVESPKPHPAEMKIASIENMLTNALHEIKALRNESVQEMPQKDFFPSPAIADSPKVKTPRKRNPKK